jgi:hypothetical protein
MLSYPSYDYDMTRYDYDMTRAAVSTILAATIVDVWQLQHYIRIRLKDTKFDAKASLT